MDTAAVSVPGRPQPAAGVRPAEAVRELAIIRDDLHCNAVRITGDDIGRVAAVAADALDQGLEAWVSPDLWDQDADTALDYIAEAARSASDQDCQSADALPISSRSGLARSSTRPE